ncbi:hypothetical protein [Nonomuraea typhae]|uniref:hypothetical protein n=1 Tax=Nonomuraea typhae TaxID=2603600 RepID=UPI0012F77550|nr:hypothetical protein [Nonomuraea typhae]
MDPASHSAFPAAPMPGGARVTLVIHWLQALIFAAATVSSALRVLDHLGRNRSVYSQVVLFDMLTAIFGAGVTVALAVALVWLHRRWGRTVAVVVQWVLAVVYALSFVLSLVGLFVAGGAFLGLVVTTLMSALPVTALVLLYKPAISAWFRG